MERSDRTRYEETVPEVNRVVTGTGDPSAATGVPTTPPGGLPRRSESTSSGQSSGQSPVEQGKQKAGEATHQAQEKATQVAGQAQEKATQVAGQVQQKAKPQLEGQKEKAAQQLSTVSHALRQTGQQLRQDNQGAIGQYADRGADQVERLSGYLHERNVNQLLDDVEQLTRQQPALFLGGAFALGALGARFLKSSRQRQQ